MTQRRSDRSGAGLCQRSCPHHSADCRAAPLAPVTVDNAAELGVCGQARVLVRYASWTGSVLEQSMVILLFCATGSFSRSARCHSGSGMVS